eukprot:m.241407 g.241407  ORF g.241407 m.241407 type:complete len:233 (-) comp18999_c0_seq1:69-767(-)
MKVQAKRLEKKGLCDQRRATRIFSFFLLFFFFFLSQTQMTTVSNITMGIVGVLYGVFGILGYLFFGDQTMSVITQNLGESTIAQVVQLTLSASLFLSHALQLFPVHDLCEEAVHKWFVRRGHDAKGSVQGDAAPLLGGAPTRSQWWFRFGLDCAVRVLVVTVTVGLAIAVDDFGVVVAVVGAVCVSPLAFILPAVYYLAAARPPTWHGWVLPITLMIVGGAASVVSLVTTFA